MIQNRESKSKNLNDLFRRNLLPFHNELERQRRKVIVSYFVGTTLSLVIAFVLFSILGYDTDAKRHIVMGSFFLGITLTGVLTNSKFRKPYTEFFKSKVSKEVFKLIAPSLEYNPSASVGQNVYRQSRLFRKQFDRFKGDDHFSGKIGETEIEFSELHSQYKVRTKNGARYVTIFKGIFFSADFHKHVQGETYVLPDVAERSFGFVGKMIQESNPLRHAPELVKMEDPEFEKEFVVYATSQNEARYCLTPSMLRRLLKLQEQFKTKIHVSILGSRINLALSFGRDLFEAPLWSPALQFKNVEEMAELFESLVGIVHELDLNTRIWTKIAA